MITSEDVRDLRVGDVVEVSLGGWRVGTALRGPVWATKPEGALCVGDVVLRHSDGSPNLHDVHLTVISRAPRPLYVNSDRTEPVPGDVVRQENAPSHAVGHTWHYLGDASRDGGRWWRFDDTKIPFDEGASLRLLVDGTTGQAVTP